MRTLASVAAVFALACESGSAPVTDAGPDPVEDECEGRCGPAEACRYRVCVPDPSPCAGTDDCRGDSYCDVTEGECLPWGVGPGGDHDESCTREVVAGVFFPDLQCEWPGPPPGDPYPAHDNVLGAPVVMDFGISGDPELPRPYIAFISYNCEDGSRPSCEGTDPSCTGVIRVIGGRNCEQVASIAEPAPIASSSLAAGDLDGDGVAELVAARVGGGLAAWRRLGGGFVPAWESESTFGAGTCNWTGPSIHDLDDDGVPEILLYGAVFAADGALIDDGLGALDDGFPVGGYVPVVADVDADGRAELVTGKAIYQWSPSERAWEHEAALGNQDAHTAVADLGRFTEDPAADDRTALDGVAEVVAVNLGVLSVYTAGGRLIFDGPIPGGGIGGPPTVADFDGDGRAEMATAGGDAYSVFDLDCLDGSQTCASAPGGGVLWSRPSQDLSSSKTGSSVFDFEGDGIAEVVYGDECFTRVYEGPTGDVLYSRYRTSCTWYENPIVADTDADFGAEVVITSNTNCSVSCPAVDPIFDGVRCFDESDCPGDAGCGRDAPGDPVGRCRCTTDADCAGDGLVCLDPIAGSAPAGKVCRAEHPGPQTAHGVRVVGDRLGRWVGTRTLWNQHAYAITHVGERGAIPRTSDWARNWEEPRLNNFRQNTPGEEVGAGLMPDLTAGRVEVSCSAGGAIITADVCNRGTESVGEQIPVAAAADGSYACTTATSQVLRPGQCERVGCAWLDATPGRHHFTVLVDDDGVGVGGVGEGLHVECRESNNAASTDADCG